MSPEQIALNRAIADYMAAHAGSGAWPSSLRAFDVLVRCGRSADSDSVSSDAMFDAIIVVALWVDETEANRPAKYQLDAYLASL